ncbi:MAG: hypothetical protein Q8O81_08075 [Giesbergeria sp.]|nr:hypothetical protein [Giesbergeria sp.]
MSALAPTSSASRTAQAALAALTRAGLRAAEDAKRSDTYMVVAENGKVLHITPQEFLRERDEPPAQSNAKTSD